GARTDMSGANAAGARAGGAGDPAGSGGRGPEDPGARRDNAVLELDALRMDFGGVAAPQGVDLRAQRGEIFAVIGPNGAGKTTVSNVVTGVCRTKAGEVRLDGNPVRGKPHEVTQAGIARTFQNIRLFPNMTATENVMVGVDARHRASVPGALLGLPRYPGE